MEIWEGPTDLLGIGLYHSITTRMDEDSNYRKFINDLEMNLIVDLEFYPLMIEFKKETLNITREIEKADVTLKVSAQDLLDLTDGKKSIVGLFLRRRLKIKPFLKLLKVYKIFSKLF